MRRGQGGTGPVAGEEEQTLPREATMSLEEIFFREHSISNAWGETLRKKSSEVGRRGVNARKYSVEQAQNVNGWKISRATEKTSKPS